MARRDQLVKSKTDFVLRKKHAVTNNGIIYENDHMTIVPDDDIYDGDIATFSDSNFKFRIRNENNEKKKHFAGNWVTPDNDNKFWTEADCSSTTITDETKITLKPDYSSIKDFAYYGSAQELVKASIRDIIMNYPPELYLRKDDSMKIKIGSITYYIVTNEFGLDIWTKMVSEESVDDPLKYLSLSYNKYLYGRTESRVLKIEIEEMGTCPNSIIAKTRIYRTSSSFWELFVYLTDDGRHIVLSRSSSAAGNPIIRLPHDEFMKRYEKLDDFSKVLLNLDTKPVFKATFESPRFDGQSYNMTYKDYIFPSVSTSDNLYFTPDLSSALFSSYLENLMSLARFHDEYDSDNIWRMLTHQSIKNLDWTFKREENGETTDSENIESTRVKAALELYGRQFDDLKRYSDNIKCTNTITYDEKNNVPDYFLSDAVENDGWEAYSVSPSTDNSLRTEVLHSGVTYSGKTSSEANIMFQRILAINSDYIQSLKGTARGVETVLSLFGLKKGEDYTIKEYVAIADRFPDECDVRECLRYYDDFYYGDDIYEDWPIAELEVDENGRKIMIPWFESGKNYPSGLYFQEYGGWENSEFKNINLPITEVKQISAYGDFEVYGETLQYMRYASSLYELTAMTTTRLLEHTVCYVEDISDLSEKYQYGNQDLSFKELGWTPSHYFVLYNTELATSIGFVKNDLFNCYGWRNVFEEEFNNYETLSSDGSRVLYMESITTEERGNNPHVGYGFYDAGESYLQHFRNIFKTEIERGRFSSIDEDMYGTVLGMGFGTCSATQVDAKTISFRDTTDNRNIYMGTISARTITTSPMNEPDEIFSSSSEMYSMVKNLESGSTEDETSSFSIINTKSIDIVFTAHGGNQYYKDYVSNVIVKYVEQMMPSTAIFSYRFTDDVMVATPVIYKVGDGGLFLRATADAVRTNTDDNYMVEYPLPEIIEQP